MNHASTVRSRAMPLRLAAGVGLLCLAPQARGQVQVLFSIDYRGSTISRPASGTGTPITESDVLRAAPGQPAFGPLGAPAIAITGGQLGLAGYTSCVGHPPGSPCSIEVDALSFGRDVRFNNTIPAGMPGRARLYFSVDRFAFGRPNTGGPPNVRSEGAGGAGEAAADVFTPYATLAGPLPPVTIPGPNVGVFDGNGLISASGQLYRGFGLREPVVGPPPFDDVDALIMEAFPTGAGAAVYFSLDAAFIDPLTGLANTGSAQFQGFTPGAVLKRLFSGGPITVYAQPAVLGLSTTADDLDALILADNGDGVYQPSVTFYDWLGGGTDMLLFSVRRGSAVIGQNDSHFGVPIEPGDILAPPIVPGQRPRIFIAAEQLGLDTVRSGHTLFGDELDSAATRSEPYEDCNNNGVDDAVDIASGSSSDTNNNNIPDECEQNYTRYCMCPAPLGPCGNHSAGTGCLNSTGSGGLLDAVGTTSVVTDDLVLTAVGMPASSTGLYFMGPNTAQAAFGDGLRCVAGPTYRLGIQGADAAGVSSYGPGIVSQSCIIGPASCIGPAQTMNFQLWYRNANVFCTSDTFNLTNGLSVVFTP